MRNERNIAKIMIGRVTAMKVVLLIGALSVMCQPSPVYRVETKTNIRSGERGIDPLKKDILLQEIELWRGTPYRFGIVERGKGTDCSGFVQAVVKKIYGIDLPRQASDMVKKGRAVTKKKLRFGDLVFFKGTYRGARGASHVGIYIGHNRFAHAAVDEGVTISDLNESYYRKHYMESRRILPD